LPIQDEALDAVVMVNVLHHMPNVEAFFKEATRSIKTNGQLAMIEPWVTPWSKFIYTTMHHEPFDPFVVDWFLNSSGPLSSANGALPWIVFERDRKKFIRKFPEWEITQIKLMMPFTYLLSGGVSLRSFMPGWSHKFWSCFEASLDLCLDKWAMFAKILLTKRS
jgi:SAM-dependent methyltransferase